MRKWNSDVDAQILREMLPDLALRLETQNLLHHLRSLGLVVSTRWSSKGKSVTLIIKLLPHHVLKISPIERGPQGFAEWGTFVRPPQGVKKKSVVQDHLESLTTGELVHLLRAHVQILDMSNGESELLSGTFGEASIEALIRTAFIVLQRTKNITVRPQERGSKH